MGLVGDWMGDMDVSCLGEVYVRGGVLLKVVVVGPNLVTAIFGWVTRITITGTGTGMGFWWVGDLVPVPMAKPVWNP